MKTILTILLLTTATVQAENYYLFTDTQKEVQDSVKKYNPATWNFDFEKSTITVQTETEDAIFTFSEYQKVESIEDGIVFDKYLLDTGGAIYVDNDIQSKYFLQIIYCKDGKQFVFRTENNLTTNKN
jgi:hypothetical protein